MNAYSDEAEFWSDWGPSWSVVAVFAITAVLGGCWLGGVTQVWFRDAAHVHLGLLVGTRIGGGPNYLGWLAVVLGAVEAGCWLFAK